jgi:hypothetical protein
VAVLNQIDGISSIVCFSVGVVLVAVVAEIRESLVRV